MIPFRQTRVGLNGRAFTTYKLGLWLWTQKARPVDLAHLNMRQGHGFKAINSTRITTFGSLLRRPGLDEMPQLCHVLNGEMSLVGLRTPLQHDVERYHVAPSAAEHEAGDPRPMASRGAPDPGILVRAISDVLVGTGR